MNTKPSIKHIAIVVSVAVVWTLIVIAFSTTMGARPLRLYDWGPPVGACLLTVFFMVKDRIKLGNSSKPAPKVAQVDGSAV